MQVNLLIKRVVLFLFLLIIAETVFSQIQKDTIFFINGTIVIGKIKKVKLGVLTFDPDDANDIDVQLRKLKTIAAQRDVFRIETISHVIYYGKLIPSGQKGYVQFVSDGDTTIFPVLDISIMSPSSNSFLQRFSGNAGLGYNYTRSSGFGRLNYDGALNYISPKDEVFFTISGIYTITDTSFSRDNENYEIKNNYYLTPTWFATIFLSYQRNLELGLQRRNQEGVGAGNKLITTKHVYTWARTGFVFNQEKNTEEVTTGTLTELFAQLEFNFFRFTKPKINLYMAQSIYYSLSQNRFRNDGDTRVSWEMVKNLKLSLEFYNNYDSKPATKGSSKFDYGILFNVSYFFY
jgi:hypothetical protein